METQKMNGIISRALAIYFEAVEAGRHVYLAGGTNLMIAELPHEWNDTPEDVNSVMEQRFNMAERSN